MRRLTPIAAAAAAAGALALGALPTAAARPLGSTPITPGLRSPLSTMATRSAAGSLAAAPVPAAAGRAPRLTTLSTAVVAPFQLAFAGHRLFIADGGTAKISRLNGRSLGTVVAGAPGVEGIGVNGRGEIAYSQANENMGTATLTIVHPGGRRVVAGLAAFEKAHNPDGRVTYGVPHPSACVAAYLKSQNTPPNQTGDVHSNPYAVIPFRAGWWLVADAGGNDILKVSPTGVVSVATVLPRQATVITAALAASLQAPPCVVGVTFYSQPVPTDLQFGPSGKLYVSTLSGAIAAGTVYTVDVRRHTSRLLASGFVGATNLAVTPREVVYVADAKAGTISRIYRGRTTTVVRLANVLSLQFDAGVLYAGTAAPGILQEGPPTGPGSLVRISF